ncbi:DUF4123 domain-containing protein [Ralstonia solanacearum]|uniref:DUF4123 domain-containing protein n=1 Tax=Ralstonia solanacearum TaxID=305 RepID=UPI0005C561D6|nr:DUF4123 domain-containing protein [Ralstonia solanacearum]MDB0543333.1 DUF4123 domain-containing protein [Ralstonia solanacearum]MDB0553457.1 DUF4123 domain-containing protein [Ralstonia solanacearum]MDB0558312.1 DUF4123 domain-containing protein [Ralstonia solanacearum]
MALDVIERLGQLRAHDATLRLYGLVDGVQYETHRGARLSGKPGLASLFHGTADAALAHAGPWLIDVEIAGEAFTADLAELEHEAPAVSWLISQADLHGLAQLLQLQLDARLPDGRIALLRFWDPRVLASLVGVLSARQRDAFFAHIQEWHLLHYGRRVHVGRAHADA